MQTHRFIVLVALAATVLPLPVLAQDSGTPENAVTVAVDAVRREPLSQTFTVIGRLVARQRGVVATRTRGAVAELSVQVGDRVREGDVLALIDRDRLVWRRDLARAELKESQASLANAEARIVSAEARVASAEARLTLARQELARLEKLRQSAAFSQARYDDKRQEVAAALSEVDEARAEVQEAVSLIDQSGARILRSRASLSIAEDDVANAEVRAPFDGVVTLRHTEAGAFLEVGDDVVTLVNDGDLEIEADVPYDRLVGLAPGVEIAVRLDDGSRHQASVRAIGVEENPKTRTRPVRFTPRFADGVRNLADGQSAALDLPIGKPRTVVSVHKDAVIRNSGQSVVYVVADGVAKVRPVELGEAIGTRFEVLSGLSAGELVVVRGNERLVPGQAVTFRESS
ncbi:MAG: efflux RND transporter periplasmic adaptor subunit [Alphaproteobacteria bacterium]